MTRLQRRDASEAKVLLVMGLLALVLSGIAPFDRLTWALEVIWVVAALP